MPERHTYQQYEIRVRSLSLTAFSIDMKGGEAGGGGCRESAAYELGGVKANLLGTNFTVFRHQYLSHSRRRRGPPEVRNVEGYQHKERTQSAHGSIG